MDSLEKKITSFIKEMEKAKNKHPGVINHNFPQLIDVGLKETIISNQRSPGNNASGVAQKSFSWCGVWITLIIVVAGLLYVSYQKNNDEHTEHMAQIGSKMSLTNEEIKNKIEKINSTLTEIKVELGKVKSDNDIEHQITTITKMIEDIQGNLRKSRHVPCKTPKCCPDIPSPAKSECTSR